MYETSKSWILSNGFVSIIGIVYFCDCVLTANFSKKEL